MILIIIAECSMALTFTRS